MPNANTNTISPLNLQVRDAVFLFIFFLPLARSTYSIAATDKVSRQVGGAGAACLPNNDVFRVLYVSAPNSTVLHTQGLLMEDRDDPILSKATNMMQKGDYEELGDIFNAMQILDTREYSFFDADETQQSTNRFNLRQYGIADFDSHAGHTGKNLSHFFESKGYNSVQSDGGMTSVSDRYNYHAIGNVVKYGTVTMLQRGFENQLDDFNVGICDMAGRLMAALKSVSDGDFGDVRCLEQNNKTSAAGAFLHIDNADGTQSIHINIIGDGTSEPIEALQKEFDIWRANNPCFSETSGASLGIKSSIFLQILTLGVLISTGLSFL